MSVIPLSTVFISGIPEPVGEGGGGGGVQGVSGVRGGAGYGATWGKVRVPDSVDCLNW